MNFRSVLRLEEPVEVAVRTASKDGRQVVALRAVERAGRVVVECTVSPVSGLAAEPLRRGPYTFSTRQEATSFLDEALRALTYLGCESR